MVDIIFLYCCLWILCHPIMTKEWFHGQVLSQRILSLSSTPSCSAYPHTQMFDSDSMSAMSNFEFIFSEEIIDQVVDGISSLRSKKILSSVALSSHCFLHLVQSYIFHTINLTWSKPQDWDTFCTILHHSPTIKFYVQRIFFRNISSDPHKHMDVSFKVPAICKFTELNSTISLFTGLQALHFNFNGQDHWDD